MTKNNGKMSLLVLFFSPTAKQIHATGFCGKNYFDLIDKKSDENGQILITEPKINEDNFIVINIYNSNTEPEQLKTFSVLQNMLDDIEISNKQIVFEDDFNLMFDCKLDTNGGNPVLKRNSIAKFGEYETPQKSYTLHQNQVSGFIIED